jgi:hypothetical protein
MFPISKPKFHIKKNTKPQNKKMMTKPQIKHPIAKKEQNKTFNLLTLDFQELNTQHKK